LPQGQFPQAGVSAVFAHARRSTPCIVVLEDIDSLVTGYNRSFFLNELDGFASNHGIVVLATTNHPERLDPAILDRPSRFDRKYSFDLPGKAERERYLRHWNADLAADLALDDTAIISISEKSDGFSFAYLRELFLSASMRWISDGRVTKFGSVMEQQVDSLRAQMAAQPEDEVTGAPPPQSGFGMPFPPHILASIRGRRATGGWTFRP
jgi:ATP-dependent 26S proteasome regulatory subunit